MKNLHVIIALSKSRFEIYAVPWRRKPLLIRTLCYTSALFQNCLCGWTIEILLHALPVQIELRYLLMKSKKMPLKSKQPACPASFEVGKVATTLQQFAPFCNIGVKMREVVWSFIYLFISSFIHLFDVSHST